VYALAIGKEIDVFQLLEMSDGDGYLYTADNFDDLNEKMKDILKRQCKGKRDIFLVIPRKQCD
jgi:hypothetical protein